MTKMKQTPLIRFSELSGRIYVVTKYKLFGNGRVEAQEKHDVTEQMENYATKRTDHLKRKRRSN